jgi:ATP-dependent protease HslVU (ClpYQ) peptidase subunit
MRYTTKLVEDVNRVRRLFNETLLDAGNLSRGDVATLLDQIETRLSPENLTCDGELSRAKVAQRRKMLEGARSELEKIAA